MHADRLTGRSMDTQTQIQTDKSKQRHFTQTDTQRKKKASSIILGGRLTV